jgi:hypothetical protein
MAEPCQGGVPGGAAARRRATGRVRSRAAGVSASDTLVIRKRRYEHGCQGSQQSQAGLREAQEALREAEQKLERLSASLAEPARGEDGLTVRELAEQFNVSAEAVRAFAETAGELLEGEPLSPVDARRAAMMAAAGVAWDRALGPLLSAGQVRELLGGVSRQRVDELLRGKRLIGLRERSGRRRYPLFQFEDGSSGRPGGGRGA